MLFIKSLAEVLFLVFEVLVSELLIFGGFDNHWRFCLAAFGFVGCDFGDFFFIIIIVFGDLLFSQKYAQSFIISLLFSSASPRR